MSSKRHSVSVRAVLFDLENTMFNARRAMFDAAKSALEKRDMELTEALFCRYCIKMNPEQFVPELLKHFGKKLSVDKILKDIEKEYHHTLTARAPAKKSVFCEIAHEALQKGLRCGAVSFLDQTTAAQLLKKADLEDKLQVHCVHDRLAADINHWLGASRKVNIHPSKCAAIASESRSCIGAIAAEMCCIVKPDAFTAFQDFGGADAVLEDDDKLTLDKMLALLPH